VSIGAVRVLSRCAGGVVSRCVPAWWFRSVPAGWCQGVPAAWYEHYLVFEDAFFLKKKLIFIALKIAKKFYMLLSENCSRYQFPGFFRHTFVHDSLVQ